MPEHQKMQKKSQKLQSMQDKKRKYLKDACACEEEMGGAEGTFRPKVGRLSEGSSRLGN